MTGDVMMKKVNRIRLYFILGTVFGITGYFAGYRYVTGEFPEEITVMPESVTEPETDQGRGSRETRHGTGGRERADPEKL